jgi:DNA (cytosine-5)-methyltransferase 1
LVKNDSNWPTVVFTKGFARHLTSSEYALLQGFPLDWGKIDAIDESEFPFWREVWNEYARVFEKKRRSDKQVRSWMASPYREYQEYQMWGNGVALPCVRYILDNIAEILRKES